MKKTLAIIGNIIVYLICWIGVFFACVILFQKLGGLNAGLKNWLDKYFFVSFTITSLVGMALRWVYSEIKHENMFEACGFKKTTPARILSSIVFGIAAGTVTTLFITADQFKNSFPNIASFFNTLIGYNFAVYLLITVPDSFLKEIVFRGSVVNELRKGMPVIWAILIHGLIYGAILLYSDMPTRIYGFAGNVIFAGIFVMMGSLWNSILANVFCSLTIFVLGNLLKAQPFFNRNPAVMYLVLAVCIVVVLLPFYFILKKGSRQDNANMAAMNG